ncbi:MAG: nucleoside hydrolase [Promethearchaeota archaeon]
MKKIPVILDTDIGTDIDDTWALALLLASPELELKLVTTTTGDTRYRALIVAKFLEIAGKMHVPIALGPAENQLWGPQAPWVHDKELESYPGPILDDAARAIVDVVLDSDELVTILGIGPLGNIAAALKLGHEITKRARFVGMQGSIYRGYRGREQPDREYNVFKDPQACKDVFSAPWDVLITPLDTCGIVTLKGERLSRLENSPTPLASALLENTIIWSWHHKLLTTSGNLNETSPLYDTVAVYLCFSDDLISIEELGVTVTDDGKTIVDNDREKKIKCAVSWKDLDSFKDLLVNRLCKVMQ